MLYSPSLVRCVEAALGSGFHRILLNVIHLVLVLNMCELWFCLVGAVVYNRCLALGYLSCCVSCPGTADII